jgi:hypothetical protein
LGNSSFVTPGLGIISTMITPAVLILAAGNLVTSTFSRLIRISDRARVMMGQLDAARGAQRTAEIALYTELLEEYRRRSRYVERALSAFYLAIGLLVMASLAIAVDRLFADRIPLVPVTFTVSGAVVLLVGTLSLFQETRISSGAIRREIDLHERGEGERETGKGERSAR